VERKYRTILDTRVRPSPDAQKRRELAYTEQVKLMATWLNGIAIAIFAVGGLAPMVAAVTAENGKIGAFLGLLVLGSVTASMWMHILARQVLRRLE
jgi:hypothetical protein